MYITELYSTRSIRQKKPEVPKWKIKGTLYPSANRFLIDWTAQKLDVTGCQADHCGEALHDICGFPVGTRASPGG